MSYTDSALSSGDHVFFDSEMRTDLFVSEPLSVGDTVPELKHVLDQKKPNFRLFYCGHELHLGVSETPDTFAFDNVHERDSRPLVEVVVDKNGKVVEVFDSRIN